jgi:hypothetical protein
LSFEADLKSHLSGSGGLVALVADRITPVLAKEGSAVPRVTYTLIANDPQSNLDGMDSQLREIHVQIDCWALTYSEVLSMFDAIRTRMDTAASTFKSVALPSVGDDYEPDTRLYRRMLEFVCWFRST